MKSKIYMCIDLKSFYASVECRERNLDPLKTNLVVADKSRTEKTICLAVTPSLKEYGLSGRSRLFEVVKKVKEINNDRKKENNYKQFCGKSYNIDEIKNNKSIELDYIIAPPQMNKYMKYSAEIYNIYLKYISKEDIYVYSIDEVFCDITNYLEYYKCSPKELVTNIIKDVYSQTGITATAGIGTNMYLAKVAMDIVAKHAKPNEIGVRIAELDEYSYRKELWNYRPLTAFWRIGPGISKKLEENKIYTMGDIARTSIENEDLLYKLFGVNAELIIDHAWGYEPTTIKEVKSYKPLRNSISQGQVLHTPYNYEKTKIIVKEMIELLSLDLAEKYLTTNQLVLTIEYDIENLSNFDIRNRYEGEITSDRYGRKVPKHSHGTINLDYHTSSSKILTQKCVELYERIINKDLLTRKINIAACNLICEEESKNEKVYEQLDIFKSEEEILRKEKEKNNQKEEKNLQHTILELKRKYGKNAILKGMNLKEGATTIERNKQVGGHKG